MTSVLIVVFDGLQPAQVRPDLMPNLSRFADEGVFFENHHPVFPSVTRINAASMVTGRYPGGHGLAANTMVARDYDPALVFSALEPTLADMKRKTGRVLLAPTLADILSEHGLEYTAIGVGTSGNAYVHNPSADSSGGATIHPEFTLPYPLSERLASRFGEWPEESQPNTPRFHHAIRILTEHILPEREPAVALIWSSEPDKAQHAYGVGSEMSDRAIREADAGFGQMMDWLETNGRAETDVMVVSDHGYSTIREVVDVESHVRDAGFGGDDVLVAPNGGSVLFYTRDSATAGRLAAHLMSQPWCGAASGVRGGRRHRGNPAAGAGRRRWSEGAGAIHVVYMGLGEERRGLRRVCRFERRRSRTGTARFHEQARDEQHSARKRSEFQARRKSRVSDRECGCRPYCAEAAGSARAGRHGGASNLGGAGGWSRHR